jgi:DNA-binding transcriptional LysR family regulator
VTEYLESIAAFVRVAREGSFSSAAREAGVSPSAVSKRITRLENQLGVALLRRTTRKVALTEVGQEFYDRCSQSLSGIQNAIDLMSRSRANPGGLLRVKVPQAFGRLHIAPEIPEFMRRFPDIQIELVFGPLERGLMEERLDVLVASADPPDINLSVQTLAAIERVTCAAPLYLERAGRPVTVDDLVRHNCLMFTGSDSDEDQWVLHEDKGVRRIRVCGSFRTNDAETIYMAVLAGLGVAHMPTFIVGPALASGQLVPLFRDAGGGRGANMKAYYPPPKNRLPKVTAFVDFLVDLFRARR